MYEGPIITNLVCAFNQFNNEMKSWLVGLESPPGRFPTSWTYIRPEVIVLYLGIPFGVGLSPQCGIGVCSGFRTSFISGSIRAYLPFAGKLTRVGRIYS
jgi:hypothetical protein